MVVSADADGLIMVHEIRDGSLVRVFVSEDVKMSGSGKVNQRTVRSLAVNGQRVIFGDDAVNIKFLDWRKGEALWWSVCVCVCVARVCMCVCVCVYVCVCVCVCV